MTIGALFFCMFGFFLFRPRFTDWKKTDDPCDLWVQICGDRQTQDALQTLMGHQDDAQFTGASESQTTAPEYLAHLQLNPILAGAQSDVEMGQQSRLLDGRDDASVSSA